MLRYIAILLAAAVLLGGCAAKRDASPEASAEHAPITVKAGDPIPGKEKKSPRLSLAEPAPEPDETVTLHVPPPRDDTPLTPQEKQALETEPEIHFDLDAHETREVKLHFKYYTHNSKGRKYFQHWLNRSEHYLPYVRKVFKERGLPSDLIYLPFVESGYNPKARSRAGAVGLWQFMPYTGKKYGLERGWWMDERLDPFKATHAAADYLEKLHDDFGDWYLALAGYNAGEGRVSKAIRKTGCEDFFELTTKRRYVRRYGRKIHYLPRETRHYVPKFLAVLKIVRNLESLGFDAPDWSGENQVAEVKAPPKTDFKAMAATLDIEWETFAALNPGFWEPASHPERASTVYVPADKKEKAVAYLSGPEVKTYTAYYRYYKVRPGDSWYVIGRRTGVPYGLLKAYNSRSSNLLRIGETIKIPGRGEAKKAAAAMRNGKSYTRVTDEKTRDLAEKRSNYRVRSGDSLWLIARRHGLSVNTLARANGLSSKARLQIGQKLYIPDLGAGESRKSLAEAEQAKKTIVYRVRRGDTLYSIARRFGVSYKALMAWNDMRSSRIYPGDNITVHLK